MRTFLLVIEKLSFSAASRELNLVTSAVSKQVSDLEKHFAVQLLYRTTRAMHLTAEGEYYREQFQAIIQRIDDLEDCSNERLQRIAGHLRITAPQGSEGLGLLERSSEFIKQYPDVRISWLFVNRFVNIVEEGIDLSIRVGDLADSSMIARHYCDIDVHFVASPDYIARHGAPSHPKELVQHQCIVDSSNRQPGRWSYRENGQEELQVVEAFIEANEGGVVASFAAKGHGIALLPSFLIQPYLDSGQLVSILQKYTPQPSPVSLVYASNRLANPALQAFIQCLL